MGDVLEAKIQLREALCAELAVRILCLVPSLLYMQLSLFAEHIRTVGSSILFRCHHHVSSEPLHSQ